MPFRRSLIEDALQAVSQTNTPAVSVSTVPVAHYTRVGTLEHFLVKGPPAGWGSAWATPVQFLNDRQELSLGLEELQRTANGMSGVSPRLHGVLGGLRTALGGLGIDAYQMSFSGNPDELGQWRGYGANGMGCCLVTEAREVHRVADAAGWVLYDAGEQRALAEGVLNRLGGETDLDVIGQTLVAAASFMKHEGFRPEQEFRLLKFPEESEIRFRETGDRLVPYVDFLDRNSPSTPAPLPVSKILIGPGWQLSRLQGSDFQRHHVVQGIQRLLDVRGLGATDIESSGIPYDPR